MPIARIEQRHVDDLRNKIEFGNVDITTKYNNWAQFVILELSDANLPFKVINLGAGVKRITTETEVCPMCKQKFK